MCSSCLILLISLAASAPNSQPPNGALAGERPRVIVSTDIGGSDPDDFQSMVHLLLYADVLDLEGLISSPPGKGRAEHLLEVIDAYQQDYSALKRCSSSYPTPEVLRHRVKQGATAPAPQRGWSDPTPGSRWIIDTGTREGRTPPLDSGLGEYHRRGTGRSR